MVKRYVWVLLAYFGFLATCLGQEKPWLKQVEIGVLGGKTENLWDETTTARLGLSVSTFFGKEVLPKQWLGIKLGIDQYPSVTTLPLGLGWRGFLTQTDGPRLVAGLDLAYGSPILEKIERTEWSSTWNESGIMIHPSVGFRLPAKKGNWGLTATVGYKRQPTAFLEGTHSNAESRPRIPFFHTSTRLPEGFSALTKTATLYHSLSIQVGLMF